MMLKLYADEAINDETSLMHIAGYLMTEDQFAHLDSAVQNIRGDLPYFHMNESHHLLHPDMYQDLVGLIRPEAVLSGFSATIFLHEHKALTCMKTEYTRDQSLAYWFGGAYTYGLGQIMAMCGDWLDKSHEYGDEYVAYIFENNPHQGDANTFWDLLKKPQYADRKQTSHYLSHTFIDGKGPLGSVSQLCDILAWNLNKFQRDKIVTPELERLLKTPTIRLHHGPKEIGDTLNGALDYWEKYHKSGRPRP